MIYKYNMMFDVWEELSLKTNGFPFFKSVNSSLFRLNKSTLLFVAGESENKELN